MTDEFSSYSLTNNNNPDSLINSLSEYSSDNILFRWEVHENGQASRFYPYNNNRIHSSRLGCNPEGIHIATLVNDDGNLVNWISPETNHSCPIELPALP